MPLEPTHCTHGSLARPLEDKVIKMFCPRCGTEYRDGFAKCSDCGSNLVNEPPPPESDEKPGKPPIALYSPNDELELSMIRGLLDANEIRYFVLNDFFGSMRVGPQIDLVNKKTIMVIPIDHDRAKEVISNFLEGRLDDEGGETRFTTGQKLRMIVEALLFTWFIPGRKRGKTKS